jgi:glycogen debranching enzyme
MRVFQQNFTLSQAIRSTLLGYFLPQVKIPELYMLDIGSLLSDFYSMARSQLPPVAGTTKETGHLKIIPDKQYRRLKATVDMELALRLYNVYRYCT